VILYQTLGNWVLRPLLEAAYRADVRGAQRIPREGPCILAANHESLVDPFVLGLATPRVVRYLAKAELYRNVLLRALMNGFGTIPVERGRGDRDAMARAREVLLEGAVLGIFPQGTSKPFRTRPFQRGAARLALETGAPIVPVCLVGTERILRPHRVRVGFPRVHVLVAPPIPVERRKPTIVLASELTARLEAEIAALRAPFGEPAHAWID
jgi:1-acyl-sn-glycerol-3-phosphate acyltransferase